MLPIRVANSRRPIPPARMAASRRSMRSDPRLAMALPSGHYPRPEWLLLAQLRQADQARTCPFIGVKRSRRLPARNDAIDPNVWSGRASQEVFVDLADVRSCINVSGL